MFYVYRQNNSGGRFIAPAIAVIVEADNATQADTIAEEVGIYFNGENDCSCCGYRWDNAEEDWNRADTLDEAKSFLTQYDEEWAKEERIPALIVLEK